MKPFSRHLFMCCLILAAAAWWAEARAGEQKPVAAGSFYPADPDELARLITGLTKQARQTAVKQPAGRPLRALIMPHAGYVYSGLTAAHAGLSLENRQFNRVIVLAPDHCAGFGRCAVSGAEAWRTPVGAIPVDRAAVARLKQSGRFIDQPPVSRAREHAVEVVLPFLQAWLKDFSLVPVITGPVAPDILAGNIDSLLDDTTLVVASSDLSHYLPQAAAREKDRETIDRILHRRTGGLAKEPDRACGAVPIETVLHLAKKHDWQPVLLHYSNSGDTAGPRDRVVGYAAVAFYGGANMTKRITQKQGKALVALARKTIYDRLGMEGAPDPEGVENEKVFQTPCGTFVTLTLNGELRGCIGSLTSDESIIDGVRRNAINAALHDPRFRPLTQEEAGRMAVEVSVLTEPQPLVYKDAKDLMAKLSPGTDGVIIKKGLAKATFLPQVWHQLPSPDEFLSQLCLKAGLPENAWEHGGLEVFTYQVQAFESAE
ncbi:MAG: AmmeMemoRadiSam system protein B [Thermodesulfobacteriota bacterium]